MYRIKIVFTIIIISSSISLFAQDASGKINRVYLQASGLTCSMCSNSINKALKTLPFVDKVDANIKTSTFDITFKRGSAVQLDKIKKKVEDAGFSVANFKAVIDFENVAVTSGKPLDIQGNLIQVVNLVADKLNGVRELTIIDKGYSMSKHSFVSGTITTPGIFHAII